MERIPLTQDLVDALRSERRRTGVGPTLLLRDAIDVPAGLEPHKVSFWLNGATKSAPPKHIDYVRSRWAALPTIERIKITGPLRAELRAQRERSGIGPDRLLGRADDIPDGLSSSTISNWLSGSARIANAQHLVRRIWLPCKDHGGNAEGAQRASHALRHWSSKRESSNGESGKRNGCCRPSWKVSLRRKSRPSSKR